MSLFAVPYDMIFSGCTTAWCRFHPIVISKVMDASGDKYWKKRANLHTVRLVVSFVSPLLKLINKNRGIAKTLTIMSLIARCNIKRFMTDFNFFALKITATTSPFPTNPTHEAMLRKQIIPIMKPLSCRSNPLCCPWTPELFVLFLRLVKAISVEVPNRVAAKRSFLCNCPTNVTRNTFLGPFYAFRTRTIWARKTCVFLWRKFWVYHCDLNSPLTKDAEIP